MAWLRPSFECPQLADLWSESMEWCGHNISGSAHLCRRLPLHAATLPVYCRCTLRSAGGCRNGKLQNVSSPSVLFESRQIFLQYTGDIDTKNDGPEFWNSNYVIFDNFLIFSKRRRAVPLQPIWTIMVTAKLDQSRVFVTTKFRQNRSTLKGRSAGQRHTDRQTNLAENNGPSGLQPGQLIKVKLTKCSDFSWLSGTISGL